MAYSTPADNPIVTEAQTPTRSLEQIFFRFFRLQNTWRKEKEKISFTCQRTVSTEGGFYRTISLKNSLVTSFEYLTPAKLIRPGTCSLSGYKHKSHKEILNDFLFSLAIAIMNGDAIANLRKAIVIGEILSNPIFTATKEPAHNKATNGIINTYLFSIYPSRSSIWWFINKYLCCI